MSLTTFKLNANNVDTVNPFSLPTVNFEDKHLLPSAPGIYFCIRKSSILYVGMSMDMNTRWRSHHKEGDLSSYDGIVLAYAEVDGDKPEILALEERLIDRFQPKLNGMPVRSPSMKVRRTPSGNVRDLSDVKQRLNKCLALMEEMRVANEKRINATQKACESDVVSMLSAANELHVLADDFDAIANLLTATANTCQSLSERAKAQAKTISDSYKNGYVLPKSILALNLTEQDIVTVCLAPLNAARKTCELFMKLKVEKEFANWEEKIQAMQEKIVMMSLEGISGISADMETSELDDWGNTWCSIVIRVAQHIHPFEFNDRELELWNTFFDKILQEEQEGK